LQPGAEHKPVAICAQQDRIAGVCSKLAGQAVVVFEYLDSIDYTGAGTVVSPTLRLITTNSDKEKFSGKQLQG
jgi:hypothetical protein